MEFGDSSVATESQPARSCVNGLTNTIWLHGPNFLTASNEGWTTQGNFESIVDCPDQRAVSCAVTSLLPEEWEVLKRYSSLNKLLRITTRCLQFIQRINIRIAKQQIVKKPSDGIIEITPSQLESSLRFWIKYVQKLYFQSEIKTLSQNSPLKAKSSLTRLNPFIDSEGCLRVGGRLQHSLLHPSEKHPWILPNESYLSKLLAIDAHRKTMHGGTQLTLSHLRQKYWVLRGRQLLKKIIFECLQCWRHRAAPTTQLMGDLPSLRVQQFRPFLHSGIDYAGPINLKCSKGRGIKSAKGYIAVFVCFSTRAVHLETVSGYSSEDFLNAYRRFVSRRGVCATLSSDCGANFVGADRELRCLFADAKAQSNEIAHLLANDGTEWRFNPPSAPHFGGLREAAVKSVKFHLKRVIGDTILTFEELSTVLAQIEACLNSRPLQPLTDDPTDLAVLTPAHFLIGTSLISLPEPSTLDIALPRLTRWQLLRQLCERFWSRWSSEYLHELQQRPKWRAARENVRVGDMCLLRSNLLPPGKWPLARILEVLPGKDGFARVVKIKTVTSTFIRPITKISILPFQDCSP